jgi:ribonuclease HII
MIEATLIASGINKIAGCDEAGRGPCAGPLVVAAVILDFPLHESLNEIADSKELSESKREELFEIITARALSFAIIEIPAEEIDTKGLHKCNLEGMRRAVSNLDVQPEYVLTDGYPIEGMDVPALAVWKGDKVSVNVGAASILAKVYRDRIMVELDKKYPGYGLADHKGYITAKHTAALNKLGVTEIHRKSFSNIAELIQK